MKTISRDLLIELTNQNKSTLEISKIINRTYGTTKNLLSKHKIKINKPSNLDKYKDQIIDLYANKHKTAKEISDILNISKDSIWNSLKKWGVKTISKGQRSKVRLNHNEIKRLKELIEEGDSINTIAKKMGYSKDVIWARAKEHGLNFLGKNKDFCDIKCNYCHKKVTPTSSRHIFCSQDYKEKQRIIHIFNHITPICNECGKEYKPDYSNLDPKFCSKSCATSYNNRNLTPEQIDNKFKKMFATMKKNGTLYSSKNEIELAEFLSKYCEVIRNDRTLIFPKEVDIYMPEFNLAIEFNGLWSHSELSGRKDDKYHLNKTIACNKKGIDLIHIFEDEWINKKDIIKSILLNKINKTSNTIYARNCEIKEVKSKESLEFCNSYHLQGVTHSGISVGLYHKNDLVSLMIFKKPDISKNSNELARKEQWELHRFCNKLDTKVTGSGSKLLNYFIKKYEPKEIISYADLRWSNGNFYKQIGFKLKHITKPTYYYIKNYNEMKRYNRFMFRKKIMIIRT